MLASETEDFLIAALENNISNQDPPDEVTLPNHQGLSDYLEFTATFYGFEILSYFSWTPTNNPSVDTYDKVCLGIIDWAFEQNVTLADMEGLLKTAGVLPTGFGSSSEDEGMDL